MSKKLLFSSFAVFMAMISNAQIQSQDFEANAMPSGWTTQLSGPGDWTFGSNIPPFSGNPTFASNAAIFNDDALGDAPASIASLLSPAIDVTANATLFLSFDYYMNEFSGDGTFKVEVFDGTAWQQLLFVTADAINMTHVSYNVTPYKNAAFQAKFTFDDEAGWSWGAAIDNFLLDETLATAEYKKKHSFAMSPNPAHDFVTVGSEGIIKNIAVYNLAGALVLNGASSISDSKVNVSDISTGVYFMTATFEDNSMHTMKLIKE